MSEIYGETIAEIGIETIENMLAKHRWTVSIVMYSHESVEVTIKQSDAGLAITRKSDRMSKALRLCFEAACDIGVIHV